jgi:hypothetical protein
MKLEHEIFGMAKLEFHFTEIVAEIFMNDSISHRRIKTILRVYRSRDSADILEQT